VAAFVSGSESKSTFGYFASSIMPEASKKRIETDILSLNQEFFGGNPNRPEFNAKVLYGDYKGGIIEQYRGFCRIWDEHVAKTKTPDEKRQAVVTTIELCIQNNYLVDYLERHRSGVEKIIMSI
jgi:hypothetical protein